MDCPGNGTEASSAWETRGDIARGRHSPPTQRQIPIYTHLHFKRDRHISLLRQQPRPMSEAVR